MARPLWTGVMSFGLVNVPVRLESAARSERPHFHLLHAKDESPVHFARICAHDGKVVPWSEIAKGYEVKKGELAVLTQEDFKRAALDRSETMDILAFVPNGAIDARYFETPYYLTPGKGGGRAYGLLREAMREANRVAVAQIVMRQSLHIGAITPVGDALVLTTLRFANEVAEIPALETPRTSSPWPASWSRSSPPIGSRPSTGTATARTCAPSSRRRPRSAPSRSWRTWGQPPRARPFPT